MEKLCSSQITLNKSVKSTYLFHDHSIKSKTKTKQLLQDLAFTNNHKLFPIHRDQAIDYFAVSALYMIYNKYIQ